MKLPKGRLPILALKNTIVFPGVTQAIRVGRERSVNALLSAERNGYWILAVQQKTNSDVAAQAEPQDLYSVATLCRVDSMKGSADSGYQIHLHGFSRVRLDDIELTTEPKAIYLSSRFTQIEDVVDTDLATSAALLESLKETAKSILGFLPFNTEQLRELIVGVDDLGYLTSICAANLDMPLDEKQKILELANLKERTLSLLNQMQNFKAGLIVQNEIRGKLNQKMGKAQRQSILREQIKAMREELGEGQEGTVEDKLRDKLDQAGLPEEVRRIADQELLRLNEVGPQSPETHIIRNYLDLLAALPWQRAASNSEIDLNTARRVLDQDHYGVDKVKRRIIQHLAVMKLKKDVKGSILLFLGPPGVGKTSLGQSIAKALGRKFARVSLGGIRDEAEIRGHRRTYVGAMPGRIIQAIKKVGENNPVFLLDEIDKLSRSWGGDPAAALLEVLDPEQNHTFLDHYLDVGFDLSKVFFIATANSLDGIPTPLLDRMEIVELSGYTAAEKFNIAKMHLIPKQLAELGLSESQVKFADDTLLRLINSFTREAGVRDLQRKIANSLRATVEKVVSDPEEILTIKPLDLEETLGSERFNPELISAAHIPGVVTGLAWTPVGGDILLIESRKMPGKGNLILTGQLGEVMKESAQIALSLVKSHTPLISDHQNDLSQLDIHIHVPAGAIPKDGPSAGVTMVSSLASLLLHKPIRSDLAMTGEVTLRGAVMPVGGIKEKIIAAHRAGIKEVILSSKNEKDLKEVPEEIRQSLQVHLVDNVEELLAVSLGVKPETSTDSPRAGAAEIAISVC